ncbi:MAG: glycosyltransferase domain-containing protein [Parachlamydiaceae bacterium]
MKSFRRNFNSFWKSVFASANFPGRADSFSYLQNTHPLPDQQLKKVVYTCIAGQYDNLISHSYICDDWDYICFTDNPRILSQRHSQWSVYPLQFTSLDDGRNSRWHKTFPDQILSGYDVSLYVDANLNIIAPDLFHYVHQELLNKPEESLALHTHLWRNCIYQEAEECIHWKLDSHAMIDQQILKLRELNYPENNGLQENNIIYRRHHDARVKQVMKEWWWWISNYSKRDQLSFNYVIWKQNFKIHLFKKQFARDRNYGILHLHVKDKCD